MPSTVQRLTEDGLIHPPNFLPTNTHLEVIMGSVAYGVSSDTSDIDLYGFCIPSREIVFPHLAGHIQGFGKQKKRFEQFQKHHIKDERHDKEYDITIYNIVKYFQLCMENNPNMVDSLFVPRNCVLFSTAIGEMVREKRKVFLHKGSWHTFKGYAYSNLSKMKNKSREDLWLFEKEKGISHGTSLEEVNANIERRGIEVPEHRRSQEVWKKYDGDKDFDYGERRHERGDVVSFGRKNLSNEELVHYQEFHLNANPYPESESRKESVKKYGYDVKFSYHVIRLLGEVEEILLEGGLTLDRKDRREQMKSIRRGEWTEAQIREYFEQKELDLEKVYLNSKLQYSPDEKAIKQLLLDCLEHHYGSLEKCIVNPDEALTAIQEIQEICERFNS